MNIPAPTNPIEVRKTILRMLRSGKASHLGCSLSLVELLIAAYESVDIGKIKSHAADRARIIVSKGHGAAGTYATMAHVGLFDVALLENYQGDGTIFQGHVSHGVPGVEHSTGALGHGLPVACGVALGLRAQGFESGPIFCVVGDGELQEGSNWEALMLAQHHDLRELTILVDNNRISSITQTDKVINLNPLDKCFEGFGFECKTVDGHNVQAIKAAIGNIASRAKPLAIVCNTVKGKDVPFAEDQPIWHYKTLSDADFNSALAHLDGLKTP